MHEITSPAAGPGPRTVQTHGFTRHRARRHRGWAAALIVVAVLGAACGGGRSADDADPSPDTETTTSPATTFGNLASPCGPGSPSGSPDVGVDASTVTIAYGDDAGYQASPGLNHEVSDAVKAMIAWCNEQGGINGRTIKGNYYDAKITEVNNVMTEACSSSFALVGQLFALPGSAEPIRIECGLPTVPAVLSGAELSNAQLMVSPVPAPIDYYNIAAAAALAEEFPEQVKKVAIMNADFPAVVDATQRFLGSVDEAGWTILDCTQTYPVTGVPDFRPYLQRVKDCGAEVVFTLNVGPSLENMLDAAAQIDFHPIWLGNTAGYTTQFANWNQNGNGDNVYLSNSFVPLEQAPPGSANAAYVDIVTANGGDPAFIGQSAASAFLLWATAAKECGNDLTRACLMTNLKAVDNWTAGGLSAPQHPGSNMVDSCTVVVKLEGTRFVQTHPSEEGAFFCDDSYAVKVDPPPDAMATLKLDSNRVSQKFGTG